MQFGVFDHMDRGTVSLGQQFEERLGLAELYDRLGFRTYHLAEHHATPLGIAASPSVYLSAVAQRTKRMRLGPLVYTLSLYHPLRLIDEICMLDQMSGGRLELGVGRGISPIEIGYFGVDAAQSVSIYNEVLEIVLKGLTQETLTHAGKHFSFDKVPMVMQPRQRPHPPLWFGGSTPETVARAARDGVNLISNVTAAGMRGLSDAYRREWDSLGRDQASLPLMGISRHVVIADTDAEALDLARRPMEMWWDHLHLLWKQHGKMPPNIAIPRDVAAARDAGYMIVGTVATVRDAVRKQIAESGANYFLCRLAFGDLPATASARSAELFAREIMPALRA